MRNKFFTIIVLVAILALGGCTTTTTPTPTPTPNPAPNPSTATVSETSKEEFSEARQWSDLREYAKAYVSGDWDGAPYYCAEYRWSAEPYIRMEGRWLYVGDLDPVIPGATLEDTSPTALDKAYADARGWTFDDYIEIVWSSDYELEFVIPDGKTGLVYKCDHKNGGGYEFYTVVDAQPYDGDAIDLAHLVEMYQSGTWDGGRIWCVNSCQVALLSNRGICIYYYQENEQVDSKYGIDLQQESTHIFPAVSTEPLDTLAGYYDPETDYTFAIDARRVAIYAADGSMVASSDVDTYDPKRAFVSGLVEGSDLAFAYDGRDTIYAIDPTKRGVVPYYRNVASVWYGRGSDVFVDYVGEDGQHHIMNRERELSPDEYDSLPESFRPGRSA